MDNQPTQTADEQNTDIMGIVNAINRVQAVIEFDLNGIVLHANDNFLATVGYNLAAIKGQHHSMFVSQSDKNSPAYRLFWAKLNRGEFDSGEYKRIKNDGSEIWLFASYNPILDAAGRPVKIIKFATDITKQKMQNADYSGQIAAIGKSQAVIEFNMDGSIITANDGFLNAVEYRLGEIQGQHHSMFVEPAYKSSPAYKEFWAKLNRGEFESGEFKRIGKGGKEIWIQASYNPIMDLNGRPFKVVKYASDITAQKNLQFTVQRVLTETKQVMNALASGNLGETITGEFSGEFAELKLSVNSSIDRLRDIVSKIRDAGAQIESGASEIANGNTDLSARTEQQASSLEETASAMEEMTSSVKQNAENAREANKLASDACRQAEEGGLVVSNAITAMETIDQSSKKIADIISVIDGIAFQTNLLALNAAVEAARAGEQGRGFAVVATEVRNLAQRSAGAAKEIKGLIKDSVDRVKTGSKLVNDSGRTLAEITSAVKKVSDIISEIAAASQEQSSGIAQVSQAVTQIDEATQQNAALVEEATAASEAMSEQANRLTELVGFFHVVEPRTQASGNRSNAPARRR